MTILNKDSSQLEEILRFREPCERRRRGCAQSGKKLDAVPVTRVLFRTNVRVAVCEKENTSDFVRALADDGGVE